jgi:hypothetical protein
MSLIENYYRLTKSTPQTSVDMASDFVFRGLHYFSGFQLEPIAVATVHNYLFKTGNTEIVINSQDLIARSGDFNFTIFEDAVVSADGTPITIQNSNRPLNGNADFVPTVGFFDTPTITNDGNLLVNFPAYGNDGAGAQGKPSVNIGGFGKEFVLKKNTNYLMRIANNLALSLESYIAFEVNWHEVRRSVGGE